MHEWKNVSTKNTISNQAKPSAQIEEKGEELWSDDFSDPSTWVIDHDATACDLDWQIGVDLQCSGSYPIDAIESSSAANGYAMMDSDAYGGEEGGTDVEDSWFTTKDSIDLSENTDVVLRFETQYRPYNSEQCFIVTSTTNTDWPELTPDFDASSDPNVYALFGDLDVGEFAGPNPTSVKINISESAGGQSQVWVRFHWTGTWGYAWFVDDVSINVLDSTDAELSSVLSGSTGAWQEQLPYYQIPSSQVTPIEFKGIVLNAGIDSVTAMFKATYEGIYDGMSDPVILASGESDTLTCTSTLTPPATNAIHTIDYSVVITGDEEDADSVNNVVESYTFEVNDYIYARDMGVRDGGSYNQGQQFEVGNLFDIYAEDIIYAIDIETSPNAVAGAEVSAKLYSVDLTTGDFTFVSESNYLTLNASEVGINKTYPLLTPATLAAGEAYLVVANSFGDGGVSDDLIVATSGKSAPQTSFYYDGPEATWFYTTSTPMVRMNFDETATISENSYNSFEVYPNPTNGIVNIKFNDVTNASISVMSLAGKEVMTSTVNGTQASFSTESLSNGVYIIKVIDGTNVQMTKVVVRK